MLIINPDKTAGRIADLPSGADFYSRASPDEPSAFANGVDLHFAPGGTLPSIPEKAGKKGKIRLAPPSINFLVSPRRTTTSVIGASWSPQGGYTRVFLLAGNNIKPEAALQEKDPWRPSGT